MTTTKRHWRSRVNRFPDRVSTLSDALRESAVQLMDKRTGAYTRAAKCYRGINANSLSRARRSGGPFAEMIKWTLAANAEELSVIRAWVDTALDTIEAEKLATPLCPDRAMLAQQEADAAEDVAETSAHLSGEWRTWLEAAARCIASTRLAIVAVRRQMAGAA